MEVPLGHALHAEAAVASWPAVAGKHGEAVERGATRGGAQEDAVCDRAGREESRLPQAFRAPFAQPSAESPVSPRNGESSSSPRVCTAPTRHLGDTAAAGGGARQQMSVAEAQRGPNRCGTEFCHQPGELGP